MKFRAYLETLIVLLTLAAAASALSPVPQIIGPVKPQAVAPGGQGFTLTVRGVNFVSGATVNWNGSARSTTFVSGDELQAQILASDIASSGAGFITVTNPGGVKSSSSYATVEIAQPISVPAFQHPHHYGSFRAGAIWTAATADFTHDGILDLLWSDGLGNVTLRPGRGDGRFGSKIAHARGPWAPLVTFGDFNGDDNLDFAYVGGQSDNVEHAHIVLANGDGTYSKAGRYGRLNRITSPTIIADLNRDGFLDFAMLDYPGRVLLGNGDGTFQHQIKFSTLRAAAALVAADFDNDGNLDLAQLGQDYPRNAITVMLGKGDGTFQQPTIVISDDKVSGGFQLLQVADLNGDGKADLIFVAKGAQVGILFGKGDGTFQAATYVASGCGHKRFLRPAAGDFNSDGKTDLGISCYGIKISSRFSFLAGNGDGTFQPPVLVHLPLEAKGASAGQGIVLGDFNLDGRLDMAALPGGNEILIYTQQDVGGK